VSAPSPDQPTIRFVEVDDVRLRTSVRGWGPDLDEEAVQGRLICDQAGQPG
jgi:hypothetical protein